MQKKKFSPGAVLFLVLVLLHLPVFAGEEHKRGISAGKVRQ